MYSVELIAWSLRRRTGVIWRQANALQQRFHARPETRLGVKREQVSNAVCELHLVHLAGLPGKPVETWLQASIDLTPLFSLNVVCVWEVERPALIVLTLRSTLARHQSPDAGDVAGILVHRDDEHCGVWYWTCIPTCVNACIQPKLPTIVSIRKQSRVHSRLHTLRTAESYAFSQHSVKTMRQRSDCICSALVNGSPFLGQESRPLPPGSPHQTGVTGPDIDVYDFPDSFTIGEVMRSTPAGGCCSRFGGLSRAQHQR